MTLLEDRRKELHGQPGLHALVIGVGHYPALLPGAGPIRSLAPTLYFVPRTVTAVCNWLRRDWDHPRLALKTLRSLVSAGPDAEQGSAGVDRCTLDNVLSAVHELREDAGDDADSIIFVYLAGHAIQAGLDHLLLLEDFGSSVGPLLRNAVDVQSLIRGLEVSAERPRLARSQLIFADMGRVGLPELEPYVQLAEATQLFELNLPTAPGPYPEREVAVFHAASAGTLAYGQRDRLSLFGTCLLKALYRSGAASTHLDGRERWAVTPSSLVRGLRYEMETLSEELLAPRQAVQLSGSLSTDKPFHYLSAPPEVDVAFSFDSPWTGAAADVRIKDDRDVIVSAHRSNDKFTVRLPAGLYFAEVSQAGNTSVGHRQGFFATPPKADVALAVYADAGGP